MTFIREFTKSATSYLPLHLIENAANYASVRSAAGLLPQEYVIRSRELYFQRISGLLGGSAQPITFLEFGVYRGDSLRQWTALNTHPDSRFIGFDSFTGLPERWRSRKAGYFDCGGHAPQIDDARVSFVPGWFNQTLPSALNQLLPLPPERQVLVHLDADLYSAALYVLTTLSARLSGFPVMFDEFGAGEGRALKDLLAAYGGTFEPVLGLKRASYSGLPTRVFGHLKLMAAP